MPLPLRLGAIELPVVGDVPGVAELAAGSPVVEPRPLGAPPCAYAKVPEAASAAANAIVVNFMAFPFGITTIIHQGKGEFRPHLHNRGPAIPTGFAKASSRRQSAFGTRIGK